MQEMMNTNYPGASAKQPNSPPVLGGQLPGLTSELPAPRGLTPYFNPMAQELQSYGRNGDSMLIHMHPDEVKGLQQLAMAHGGSLTINPHTGLPEANFLKKLLPTILGAVLAPFTGGLSAALLVGAGYTVATGSLQKGLMAGLGAFGGAGIGNAIANIGAKGLAAVGQQGLAGLGVKSVIPGVAQAGAKAAAPELASLGVKSVIPGVVGEGAKQAVTEVGKQAVTEAAKQGIGQTAKTALTNAGAGLKELAKTAMTNPLQAARTFGGEFANAARGTAAPGSFMYKYAPTAAGFGAFTNIADAMQPPMPEYAAPEETKWTYDGPYTEPFRQVSYPNDPNSSAEHAYFTQSNPIPGYRPAKAMSLDEEEGGYAEGGLAALPASEQFKKLVEFYNEGRPGAITASLTYPKKAAPTTSTTNTGTTNTGTTNTGTTNTGTTNTGTGATSTGSTEVTGTGTGTVHGRYGVYTPGVGWGVNPRVVTEDSVNYQDATGPHTSEVRPIGSPGAPVLTGPTSNYGVQDNSSLNDIIASNIDRINADNGVTQDMLNRAANNMFGTTGVNYYAQTGSQGANTQGGGQAVNTGQTMGGNALTLYDGSTFTLPDDFLAGTEARAAGGRINMGDGSFVVDARTVSELGNGSSNAGIDLLSRMGGQPVRGPGDGVSDSIPASIGGRQPARVARDEVVFPPQAVRRMGGGNEKRGTQKLYAMMDKAHAARKRAGRGTDTKLRRGLA